jgi:hypothetical protein
METASRIVQALEKWMDLLDYSLGEQWSIMIKFADLCARRAFCSDEMVLLVIEQPHERVDIDTDWDWSLAEAILAACGGSDE